MKFLQSIYLRDRLYWALAFVVLLFLLAYVFPVFFGIGHLAIVVLLLLFATDFYLLYGLSGSARVTRLCAERFSNGDANQVQLVIENRYPMQVWVTCIDEIPHQFQQRNVFFFLILGKYETRTITYSLRPVQRGIYSFGLTRVFVRSAFSLMERRFDGGQSADIQVYPSFLQLQKYELMAISRHLKDLGIKKIRKIGHNIEFEHIKPYIQGDDVRTINWKASARAQEMMVNQFQDEKSQNVYSLIDKGRLMQMPFAGMSLLDYAINSSLMVSSIAIKREDNAGVMTFEKQFDGIVPAGKRRNQMHLILEFLYNQATTFGETDFSSLFVQLNHHLRKRSLLLLYTNFESIHNLDRQLPYFQKLARSHLLVVIFFVNTELQSLLQKEPDDAIGVYQKVIAEHFAHEKLQICKTLQRYGVQTVLSKPEELSINVINKYIELKARQLI